MRVGKASVQTCTNARVIGCAAVPPPPFLLRARFRPRALLRGQTHKLSEQEESEIRECFALFDRDKDGKIKVEELGLIMRSLGRAPTELEVKEYQKSVDKGDGHRAVPRDT